MKLENEYRIKVPDLKFTPNDHLYFEEGYWSRYSESQKRTTAILRGLAKTMPPHHYKVTMDLTIDASVSPLPVDDEGGCGHRYIDEHYVMSTTDQADMMVLSWVVCAQERTTAALGLEFMPVMDALKALSYFGEYNKGKFYDRTQQQPAEIVVIKAGVTLGYLKEHATVAVQHSYKDGVPTGITVWVKPNEDEHLMACLAIAVPVF
jgi:hypothetical protein